MATVRLASDLAMPSTTVRPVTAASYARVLPSGKVRMGMMGPCFSEATPRGGDGGFSEGAGVKSMLT